MGLERLQNWLRGERRDRTYIDMLMRVGVRDRGGRVVCMLQQL